MLEKYVDERWPTMLDFPQADPSQLCVCTVDDAVSLTLPAAQALNLQAEWNRLQAALVRCALAFDAANPEAFSAFWYGTELRALARPAVTYAS